MWTPLPAYAELHCLSSFSFQRGASLPEVRVAREAALDYTAQAFTDGCSVAGIGICMASSGDACGPTCTYWWLPKNVTACPRKAAAKRVKVRSGAGCEIFVERESVAVKKQAAL